MKKRERSFLDHAINWAAMAVLFLWLLFFLVVVGLSFDGAWILPGGKYTVFWLWMVVLFFPEIKKVIATKKGDQE